MRRRTASNFEFWLRTGRLVIAPGTDPAEAKFDPWHDPSNGRFTFAGGNSFAGHAPGGVSRHRRASPTSSTGHQSFGGGGASGNWQRPPAPPARPQTPASKPHQSPGGRRTPVPPHKPAGGPAAHRRAPKALNHDSILSDKAPVIVFPKATPTPPDDKPLRSHTDGGYQFHVDSGGRPRRANASELRLVPGQARSETIRRGRPYEIVVMHMIDGRQKRHTFSNDSKEMKGHA